MEFGNQSVSVSSGRRFAVHQCPHLGGHWASADGDQRLVGPDLFWLIGRLDGVVTAVVAVEPASAHSTVLRKDAAMGQVGHAWALPLYPQFGTEPNGFYIPPRWAPRDYLIQMFGPGVEHAIEQYSCPDRQLLAVLQLFRAQRQILFRFEIQQGPKIAEIPVTMPTGAERVQELFNDTVIGYNKLG